MSNEKQGDCLRIEQHPARSVVEQIHKGATYLGKFTRELLQKRVEAFRLFIGQQGWSPGDQPRENNGVLPFLVTDGKASIMVRFTPQGGIHIWGKSSALKTRLIEWIGQEQPRYFDHSAAWLSLQPGSSERSHAVHDLLIAQIQMTANGLILTDVDGVRFGIAAPYVLEVVDWVAERRDKFEQMALRLKTEMASESEKIQEP